MATSTIKGMEFKETNLSGGYISGEWRLSKIGRIVFMQVVNFSSAPAGNFKLGATIPAEYRPAFSVSFTLTRRANVAHPIAITVGANGDIPCYNYGTAHTQATPYNQLLCWFTN